MRSKKAMMQFQVRLLKLEQDTRVNYNKDSIIQACNYTEKGLPNRCFPVINTNFLRTPILKNICERLILKIYPVLFDF